MSAILLSVI